MELKVIDIDNTHQMALSQQQETKEIDKRIVSSIVLRKVLAD